MTTPKIKAYLAGPMSNIPYFNFPAFLKAGDELKAQGYDVFNPAEEDIKEYGEFWTHCHTGSHDEAKGKDGTPITYRDVLRKDLNYILDHLPLMVYLPGWERSKGVKAEKALAECLGLKEIYL